MRWWIAALVIAGILVANPAVAEKDPDEHFFNETWNEFDEELQRARDEGKKGVFIFFEMDECPFCHWMRENVLNETEVQEYFRENFLNFTVDIEGDIPVVTFDGESMPQKEFAFEHRVRATPVLAFFDLEGERVYRYTGKTSGVEEFLTMGRYVVEEAYQDEEFPEYQESQKDAGGDEDKDGASYY
ncbi:MAG: thioredoxin family protein [Thiohalospira sp.]|uniref:thioredoxin family protein n=1 Tax=Thiohalospira sp. TaxID=3080549 RepID=UPI00397F3B3C